MENLRDAINECTDYDPWCSGVLKVPREDLELYYGDPTCSRSIHIPDATGAQLDELCAICEPASFGLDKNKVLDETYRKALKLDRSLFALNLSPARLGIGDFIRPALVRREKDMRDVIFDLYKLNVYGKDSFFKSHKDTPRGEDMFGFLVIVLPTKHEGGSLVLRHKEKEFKFDSAQLLKDQDEPSIAFIAFYSDIDHEVEQVTSGKRITITYNLYFAAAPVAGPKVRVGPKGATLQRCIAAIKAYTRSPKVFPKGGYLGFSLAHEYPMDGNKDLEALHDNLKGGDAILYEACEEVGLKVSLRPIYSSGHYKFMSEKVIEKPGFVGELDSIMFRTKSTPIEVHHEYRSDDERSESDLDEYEVDRPDFQWIRGTSYKMSVSAMLASERQYGNDPALDYLYGSVNMVAYVPEPSKRKALKAL